MTALHTITTIVCCSPSTFVGVSSSQWYLALRQCNDVIYAISNTSFQQCPQLSAAFTSQSLSLGNILPTRRSTTRQTPPVACDCRL
ncbi:hypothetical protein RSAG8_06543, partial [Rhizoctonia solani AG-8 WAC10335]